MYHLITKEVIVTLALISKELPRNDRDMVDQIACIHCFV